MAGSANYTAYYIAQACMRLALSHHSKEITGFSGYLGY
jgi:hypothetical protein